ncbi:GAF domain-containing protein [Streptomyces sp. NPDC088768]|uniref:GAF domain-containing protein n=1 Tax=Streptomyces sp. NPDC088768 TaxID=3365894 RepID=UPI00380971CD
MTSAHLPGRSPQAAQIALLDELGLTSPRDDLDAIATEVAHLIRMPYAMANFFGPAGQNFLGLHQPAPDSGLPQVGRSMKLTMGFCPEVRKSGNTLILPNVHVRAAFSSNRVVDEMGMQTYAGVPLIVPARRAGTHKDLVLGTLCGIGQEPRDLSDVTVKDKTRMELFRDDFLHHLFAHAGLPAPS